MNKWKLDIMLMLGIIIILFSIYIYTIKTFQKNHYNRRSLFFMLIGLIVSCLAFFLDKNVFIIAQCLGYIGFLISLMFLDIILTHDKDDITKKRHITTLFIIALSGTLVSIPNKTSLPLFMAILYQTIHIFSNAIHRKNNWFILLMGVYLIAGTMLGIYWNNHNTTGLIMSYGLYGIGFILQISLVIKQNRRQ